MANAKDFIPDKTFHGLFVGPSGSGKTCAGVTIGDTEDKFSKVFILDVDNRWEGINAHPDETLQRKIKEGYIEYERFNKKKISDNVADLEARLNSLRNDIIKGAINTIILSSTTSTNELFKENARQSPDIKHHTLLGKTVTQKQDYLYIDRAQRDLLVETLNKLPCNIVIEAHITDDGYNKSVSRKAPDGTIETEDVYIVTGKKINLPGKLSTDVPTWYNETYEFYIDETIQGQPRHMVKFHGKFAKTSFPRLPVELNWTGKNFYRFVSGVRDGVLDKMGNVIKK